MFMERKEGIEMIKFSTIKNVCKFAELQFDKMVRFQMCQSTLSSPDFIYLDDIQRNVHQDLTLYADK